MTFEEELGDVFSSYFKDTFDSLGFIRDDTFAEGMGAVWSFSNEALEVDLINDRGIIDVMITGPGGKSHTEVQLLAGLLHLDFSKAESFSKKERKEILMKPCNIFLQSRIFSDNYEKFVWLFNSVNIQNTLSRINELRRERSRYSSR